MGDVAGGFQAGFGRTQRRDAWWLEPVATGVGFLLFVLYANWAAFQGEHYYYGSYLSPFYSPLLYVEPTAAGAAPLSHAWFGAWPSWWPGWLPASPAFLILAGPLSFRLTCYYYRKFYYRSYFGSPPACAVGSLPRRRYSGETRLFLFQNIHRYTLYLAIVYIFILYYDAALAFFRNGELGVGVGSVVLLINPTLLACYTFGCHAFRHLIGGNADCFSCPAGRRTVRHTLWQKVTALNGRHMMWAWLSLIWVGFSDLYVRMVSMGIWHDFSTWGTP